MRLRAATIAVALAGLAIAGYLTWVHYGGIEPVCGLGGDCEKVQTSEWSELVGIPVALLGLGTYALIAVASFVDGWLGQLAAVVAAWVGAGFSAYLTYRELFTIEAICQWCVASAVLMTALAVLTTARSVREA